MMSESNVKTETATENMMVAKPQKEHHWLQKLVGEWTYEAFDMGPDGQQASGGERVRAIGDVWIVAEGTMQMPDGSPGTSVMTLGYNPDKKRFTGTWIGSMMTHLWIYDGELDASGRVLTLDSEGPSFSGDGTMSRYRDIIELKSDDHRTLSGNVLEPDGTWKQFMTMELRRSR
jgi:hypothetical protein